jgi:hypothetical protein
MRRVGISYFGSLTPGERAASIHRIEGCAEGEKTVWTFRRGKNSCTLLSRGTPACSAVTVHALLLLPPKLGSCLKFSFSKNCDPHKWEIQWRLYCRDIPPPLTHTHTHCWITSWNRVIKKNKKSSTEDCFTILWTHAVHYDLYYNPPLINIVKSFISMFRPVTSRHFSPI